MDRCPECPAKHKCIPGDGPLDAKVWLIGEAPGTMEEKEGRVFIGKTGKELNEHYLPLAGLKRSNVRILNAIKCLPDRTSGKIDLGRSKDLELLYSCAGNSLYGEIEQGRLGVMVTLGAFAAAAIDPSIELELHHGLPRETSFGTVFPMFHPAGGIHEPKKMLQIRTDWYRLGQYLKGKLVVPEDEYPEPDYQEGEYADYYLTYPFLMSGPMACDTESDRHSSPFCLTYSMHPGTGRVIRVENTGELRQFQYTLDNWTGPIAFHNHPYDHRVVTAMGLHFPRHLIVDTMQKAYHLGNLPQGLKALAYRELGMQMEDFDDLVTPYSTPLCLDYLREVQRQDWPKPQEVLVRDPGSKWKLYKPQSISTKLKRFFTDLDRNPQTDIFERWANWEAHHQEIELVCGPWPGKDIRHVPFDKIVYYACRDADATLRLLSRLEGMRRDVRKTVQEKWGR